MDLLTVRLIIIVTALLILFIIQVDNHQITNIDGSSGAGSSFQTA